jgi:hypothetical protein
MKKIESVFEADMLLQVLRSLKPPPLTPAQVRAL